MDRQFALRLPVLALAGVLAGGGAFGAVSSFSLQREFWAWPMPDLAYRFLAGAAAAYAVGSLIALTRQGWPGFELLLATVILYGIPLGAAVLVDSEVIDWEEPVAWGFVGLVVSALAISVAAIWLNRNLAASVPGVALGASLRSLLLGLGVLAGLVGVLVFFVPREAGFVWPWAELAPWKPLDSRLLASMLLTISGGALLVAWRNRRDMAGVFLPMLWAYCIVAGLGLILHATDTPALRTEDLVYVAIFSLVLVGTAALYLVPRRALSTAG